MRTPADRKVKVVYFPKSNISPFIDETLGHISSVTVVVKLSKR